MRTTRVAVVVALVGAVVAACGVSVAGTGVPASLPSVATVSTAVASAPTPSPTGIEPDRIVPATRETSSGRDDPGTTTKSTPSSTAPSTEVGSTSEQVPDQLVLVDGEEKELAWSFPPSPEGWSMTMLAIGTMRYQHDNSPCMVFLDQPRHPEPVDQSTVLTGYAEQIASVQTGFAIQAEADPLHPTLFNSRRYLEIPGSTYVADGVAGTIHAVASGRYALVAITMCPIDTPDLLTEVALPLVQSLGAMVL